MYIRYSTHILNNCCYFKKK